MASVRQQLLQAPGGSTGDGNHTSARHASFTQIYVHDTLIGGCEQMSWNESNGTHKIPQIGNDKTENVRGMRYITGSLQRFQIRERDMRQIYQNLYPDVSDIDFSQMPADWKIHYMQQSLSGKKTFEDGWWTLYGVIITDYGFAIPNANDVLRDSVTFIADGVESWDQNGRKLSFPHNLMGMDLAEES